MSALSEYFEMVFKRDLDEKYCMDCVLLNRPINILRSLKIDMNADPDYEPIEYAESDGIAQPLGIINAK